MDESGDLTYRFAIDPQGTVVPQRRPVDGAPAGRLPAHASLPDGWSVEGTTLSPPQTDALDSERGVGDRADPASRAMRIDPGRR